MKELIIFFIVIVVTSCGSSSKQPEDNKTLTPLYDTIALKIPKDNTDYKNIIGKPVKIGNLIICQYDFPEQMYWDDAVKACKALGDGWRLPNEDEIEYLNQNKVVIGGFNNSIYWMSRNFTAYDFKLQAYLNITGKTADGKPTMKESVRAISNN